MADTPTPEDSILVSVKKLLGIAKDDLSFDPDIILYTNTVLANLSQLGVGDGSGIQIKGYSEGWSSIVKDDVNLNLIQTYVCLKVRVLFDPPSSQTVMSAIQANIKEYEYRIYTQVGQY
jgi:hypothetical protein